MSLRKSTMQDIASIDTPDATTVVFKLKTVNASMLDNLASPFNCVYSAAKLKEDPKFPEKNILGSGAFQFVEYVRGTYLPTKRFDGYFRKGLPYLDGYKAYFVKSGGVVPGMLGGQFDVEFRGRTPSERDQLLKSADKDRWVLHEGPWATVDIVIFNTTQKPFDDPRVRRALSLAIDRWGGNEALSKITFVKATGGFLRPGYEYALPEAELVKIPGYDRDIEKSRAEARRLLKEAGAENLSLKLHNRTVAEPYTPVGVFLIDQWKRIGVTVEHSQVETSPYFGNLVEGNFDVALYPITVPADEVTAQHQSLPHQREVADQLLASHRQEARRPLGAAEPHARSRKAQGDRARVRAPPSHRELFAVDQLVAAHHRAPQENQGLALLAKPLPGAGPDRGVA